MARETEVRFEQIQRACTEIFAAGETPSFRSVYNHPAVGGKGGQAVVSDMIRRWKQETAATITAKRENPTLPLELVSASDDLVGSIWKLALARAEEAYQQKVGELSMKESEWQVKLDQAADKVQSVERASLAIQAELASCKATLTAREEANAELETRNRELQAALAARDDQVTALREDLARTMTTLEGERARHDEVLQAAQRQHEDAMRAEKERHTAELAEFHRQAEADRKHFLQQTDDLRQAGRVQADHLREQLAGEKAAAEGYRKQAYSARDEAAKWQGKFELLQGELTEARKIIAKVQKHRARTTDVESPTKDGNGTF